MIPLLTSIATPLNFLSIATAILLVEVFHLQKPSPQDKAKLQKRLDRIETTTKISTFLLIAWAFTLLLPPTHKSEMLYHIPGLIGCLLAITLQIQLSKQTTWDMAKILSNETIAIISLFKHKKLETTIWFKKTGDEWPPIRIEAGYSHITSPLHLCSSQLNHEIKERIQSSEAFNNEEFQSEFKKTLRGAGVTHPIDITGNDYIPELHAFLEKTLLPKPIIPHGH